MIKSSLLLCLGLYFAVHAISQNTPDSNQIITIQKLPLQPKFYINVHGGYALALGSTFKFYPDDVKSVEVRKVLSDPKSETIRYETVKKGLGEGFRIGIGGSYIINDFINLGLDIDYFQSTIQKERDSIYYELNANPAPMVNEREYRQRVTISYKTSLITFVPNITFKAISRPNFFIYNKIGAVLSFRPNSLQKEKVAGNQRTGWQGFYQDSSFASNTRYSWGIRNPSFGFMGGIGIQLKLKERIRTFAEIQFSHIVFRTKSRSLTSKIVNGNEMVNTLSTREKEIQFRKDFVQSGSMNGDPNQPLQAVVQRFPISYVGLQLGVAYRF